MPVKTAQRMAPTQFVRPSVLSGMFWRWAKGLIVLMLMSGAALSQVVSLAALADAPLSSRTLKTALANSDPVGSGGVTASPVVAVVSPEAPSHQRFWDNENRVLFAAVAALSAADFAVTRANLQSGGKELNPVTRLFSGSTAGLAANFAGQSAGIVGISYLFHKTGHHKLERLTPMLNIGASSFAVAYDLGHR